jgi:hypothetical protein
MRVEEKLLSIRKIVVRLSIFDQCGLQNDVGIRKELVQGSRHNVVSTY